jgi:hypothetical protein
MVGNEAGNGSVELGNTLGAKESVPLKPKTTTAEIGLVPTPARADGEPAKDACEQHGDLQLKAPRDMPAATSAWRRYRKIDLSAYRVLEQSIIKTPAH